MTELGALLTQAAGSNNLARFTLIVPFLASAQKDVINSFYEGGGVSYSAYLDFMKLWAEINKEKFDTILNQVILPLIPDVVENMYQGVRFVF